MENKAELAKKLDRAGKSVEDGIVISTMAYLREAREYAANCGLPFPEHRAQEMMYIVNKVAAHNTLDFARRVKLPYADRDPGSVLDSCASARQYTMEGGLDPADKADVDEEARKLEAAARKAFCAS